MNKTVIHTECGGKYGSGGDKTGWNSKEAKFYALSFKEEITYANLVDKIRKKMGIDEETSKVKLSYVPLLLKPPRVFDILDDDDVDGYISSIDKEECRSVLRVELVECENESLMASVGDNVGDNDVVDLGEESDGEDPADLGDSFGENLVDLGDDVELPCDEPDEPNLEEWYDGTGLELGQEFVRKKQVQNIVLKASLKECYEFDVVNTDTWRYVIKCRAQAQGCKWYLRVSRPQHSKEAIWSVKRYRKMHSCTRASSSTSTKTKKRQGNPELVAEVIKEDYSGVLETPTPKALMDIVQAKIGVKLSYPTALRGKHLAAAIVRGTPAESYQMLPSYLYVLRESNVGTSTSVLLEKETKRFKYLFIALGACIEGFELMRKVLAVDATFLKHGGVLVFAVAQDPNRHHYPVAFGILDSENDASWNWFFKMLSTVVPDSTELVFMSDRNSSLIKAVGAVYPQAQHGYCVFHLSQNVRQRAPTGSKDYVAAKFKELAGIYTAVEFETEYAAFRKRYPKVALYLDGSVDVSKWARCYFKGARYNIETTNSAESMNNVFKKARGYALVPMIDVIVGKILEWFNKHRKKAASAPRSHKMVPWVENELHPNCQIGSKLKVSSLNSMELEFSVIGMDGNTYTVDLKNVREDLRKVNCTCKRWNVDMYPCVHVVAAAIDYAKSPDKTVDINVYDMCAEYYSLKTWVKAYERTIYKVPHQSQWLILPNILAECVFPPDYPQKKGRKQETRFPSPGEGRVKKKRKTCNKTIPGRTLEQWFTPMSR